jgi:hypothetical protein
MESWILVGYLDLVMGRKDVRVKDISKMIGDLKTDRLLSWHSD